MSEGEAKQEVELRALLEKDQWINFSDSLEKIGAKLKDTEEVKDTYFCPIKVKSFEEIEMDEVGSYSLRLREKKKDGQTKVDLNIKVITKYGDHHSWAEHEIKVDSFKEAEIILESIGFKKFFNLEKKRSNYILDDVLIIIEDIADFHPAIELEIMTTKEESEQAKSRIRKVLIDLGVREDQIVTKSITNLIMREKSTF